MNLENQLEILTHLISDQHWPMPDIYFKTNLAKVRGFSFLFPNASYKLKDNETGTEVKC